MVFVFSALLGPASASQRLVWFDVATHRIYIAYSSTKTVAIQFYCNALPFNTYFKSTTIETLSGSFKMHRKRKLNLLRFCCSCISGPAGGGNAAICWPRPTNNGNKEEEEGPAKQARRQSSLQAKLLELKEHFTDGFSQINWLGTFGSRLLSHEPRITR